MTNAELSRVLQGSGVPFAYRKWETAPKPPYGVYLLVSESNMYADGELYFHIGQYQVELYTAKKSPATEKKVEAALAAAGIPYAKSEYYIESEKLYEILYECEV